MAKAKYYNGKTITEWAKETGIKRSTLNNRIKDGWTIEEAVSTPYGEQREKYKKDFYVTNLAIENKMSLKTLKKRINVGMTIEEAISYNYKKNYIGIRSGRLLVIKEIDAKRDKSGKSRRQFLCLCDCGNYTTALGENLSSGKKQSCGCLRKETTSKMREKDLTGETFGRWHIEGEAFRDRFGIHWNAICLCGNRGTPTTNSLLNGSSQSCGCLNKDILTSLLKADIQGQKFGRLLAEECVGQNAYHNYLWKCRCDCGAYVIAPATRLLTGETQSCGCMVSRGEEKVAKYLSERNIYFSKGKTFDDLFYYDLLKFDFEIISQEKKTCLIEYQGIQHYKKQKTGFGDLQREITDKMKKDYCLKHNVPLFEIRYDEDVDIKMNEIIAQVNPVLRSEISDKV